ncbi:MAG: divalent-cation tolerance protein CutA [Calditrichia bacterium]
MENDIIIVYCTLPDMETAKKIASHLVENHLAACCNIIPGIQSIYRWQGEIQQDNELLMLIKTRQSLFDKLAQAIRELHPYEVPEIIASSLCLGNEEYLKWVMENVE